MTPGPGIEPWTNWWEAKDLATARSAIPAPILNAAILMRNILDVNLRPVNRDWNRNYRKVRDGECDYRCFF